MRFEYYHAGLANVPKLSVDGTVDNSVHFSHWQGNSTPPEVKADTSTEIALNLAASPDRSNLTQGIDLVTNNHFDTDGVLSVWVMLNGERALDLRERLIAAAEAGDFSEYTNDDAVRASIVIQGSDQSLPNEEAGSPIALHLGESVDHEARAYALVLPEVERILTRTADYEPLWRDAWQRIVTALESFSRRSSRVVEYPETGLSVVMLAPEIFSPHGFNPTRHTAPFTAISHNARGRLFLIATPMGGGWNYRIDYPYYSWAETVIRPGIERRDFSAMVAKLNVMERDRAGLWKTDDSELASAVKFVDPSGMPSASSLLPEVVAAEINATLIGADSVGMPAGVSLR
jgi:hypothetical protein